MLRSRVETRALAHRGALSLAVAAGVVLIGAAVAFARPGFQSSPRQSQAQSAQAALIADAKRLISLGSTGVLYYPGPEAKLTPANVQKLKRGIWRGPTTSPAPQTGKKVTVLSCLAGSACEFIAKGVAEAGKALGWQVKIVNGTGTPDSFNQLFSSILAEKPDGIIAVAVPSSQVGDKIAAARSAGIKLAAVASNNKGVAAASSYTVDIPLLENIDAQLQAYYAIATSNGTAKVVYLWDYGFPSLVDAIGSSLKVMKKCTGCKVLEVHKTAVTTFVDPVATQKLVTSLIQKYGKELQYLVTPYGVGISAVVNAVRAAGRSDIKVLSKSAYPETLGLVAKGQVAADFGASLDWTGWAIADELNRLFAGAPALPFWQEGLAVRVYTKANSPANGNQDWTKLVDYKSAYKKTWKVP